MRETAEEPVPSVLLPELHVRRSRDGLTMVSPPLFVAQWPPIAGSRKREVGFLGLGEKMSDGQDARLIQSGTGKRQPLAAYRFGGLECMLLGPGEGGLMSMIG